MRTENDGERLIRERRSLFGAVSPDAPEGATGIVSATATDDGLATIWQRSPAGTARQTRAAFAQWFLLADLDPVQHLPHRFLSRDEFLSRSADWLPDAGLLTVVPLHDWGDVHTHYRLLVLLRSLNQFRAAILDAFTSGEASGSLTALSQLRPALYTVPAINQYLMITGSRYFQGLDFPDLHRLQFDLETTGLSDQRDRIFMISLRDSTGWHDCLDTGSLTEAELIERFARVVMERDPDVLENHNIFDFDLRFLVTRAAALGVPLPLGRDASPPTLVTDVLTLAERIEPFGRWKIAGREIVDTLHLVKVFSESAPDMGRHGLKAAARFFGFAKPDRVYVEGAEIWPTFQADPGRVRQYSCDDVEEVDELSGRLLPPMFCLTQMLPRTLEQVSTDGSAVGLIEPTLVTTYLRAAWSLPEAITGEKQAIQANSATSHAQGVVKNVMRVELPGLSASLAAAEGISPAADTAGAYRTLVSEVSDRLSMIMATSFAPGCSQALEKMAVACGAYLAAPTALLGDLSAAAALSRLARGVTEAVAEEFERHGAQVVERDAAGLLVTRPGNSPATEDHLSLQLKAHLPVGTRPRIAAVYRAVLVHGPGSFIYVRDNGVVTFTGEAHRIATREAYGEQFLRRTVMHAASGDIAAVRAEYLAVVERLRGYSTSIAEVCQRATVHKSRAEYAAGERRIEACEVLLDAGLRSWQVGTRIRYFRDRNGTLRLLLDGQAPDPGEMDIEHYVRRVGEVYGALLRPALSAEQAAATFAVPTGGIQPGGIAAGPSTGHC